MTGASIHAIDLFCGAGGLSIGLQQAGITVACGIDVDPACRYPYETNVGAEYLQTDVRDLQPSDLEARWSGADYRLLAGCAPCQPFSSHRRGRDTTGETNWSLLGEFLRLALAVRPDFLTMENVPRVKSSSVFHSMINELTQAGYRIHYGSTYGPTYGLPQERRRLVLVGSLHDDISIPEPAPGGRPTVRKAIGKLPKLESGMVDPRDPLHKARALSDKNLRRLRASRPGGTWSDWPDELLAPCHTRQSGSSFKSFYGRMTWDDPSPTITTQSYNLGTGRFGHPDQDRTISLREAAILQGFPKKYQFVDPSAQATFQTVGRLIGNAVPPPLGRIIGEQFVRHARSIAFSEEG